MRRALLFLLAVLFLPAFLFGQTGKIRVAIYEDDGGGETGVVNVEKSLSDTSQFITSRVDAAKIRSGILRSFDVVVQAGGRGSKQAAALQSAGVDSIREFVGTGGGYLGICAGAYLSTVQYPWSLGILNADVVDRDHWNRGSGMVRIRLTEAGRKFFGTTDTNSFEVQYGQGPLLTQSDRPGLHPYNELAVYETEIAENGALEGAMPGTTAMASGEFGLGRVVAVSPHPEKSEKLRPMISAMVKWLAVRRDESGE
jgi:hypothetical protein